MTQQQSDLVKFYWLVRFFFFEIPFLSKIEFELYFNSRQQ